MATAVNERLSYKTNSTVSQNQLVTKLLKGGSWAFLGRIVSVLVTMGVNALLARLLLPEVLGQFFLVFSMVMLFSTVTLLGLEQTAVRLVTQTKNSPQIQTVLQKLLFYITVGSVIASIVFYLGGGEQLGNFMQLPQLTLIMLPILCWSIIHGWQKLAAETFRGFYDIGTAVFFSGISTSLFCLLYLSTRLLRGHLMSLSEVIWLFTVATTVSVIIAIFFIARRANVPSKVEIETDAVLPNMLGIMFPFFITNLIFYLLGQVDLWVIGANLPSDEVALYGAALRLVRFVAIPLLIINAFVPPLIAELFAAGEIKRLERMLRTVATVAGVPALLVLVGLIAFATPVLELVYGSFYGAGAMVLIVLSLGQFVNVWSGSCGLSLMMTGQQQVMMGVTMVGGLVTVGLAVWWIRPFGIIGVAAASSLGLLVQNIGMWLGARVTLGIWTHFSLSSLRDVSLLWQR